MVSQVHAWPIVLLTLLVCAAIPLPLPAVAAGSPADYETLLKEQGLPAVMEQIQATYPGNDATANVQQLARVLAASLQNAAAAIEQLAMNDSTDSATLAAELMLAISARVGGRSSIDDASGNRFADQVCRLLDHRDPFVRAIAARALARLHQAISEGGDLPNAPAWLPRAREIEPESSLECEFVEQAMACGVHRSPEDLAESAQDLVQRARLLASYALAHGSPSQQLRTREAMDALQKACSAFDELSLSSDLTDARIGWLKVRRAVRQLVFTGPDWDNPDIVFFLTPRRTEENHPDGLVQNHDRPKERPPGGDICIKTGSKLDAPPRALIAGQLGPGHVQDMDLWWNADRLVFSFVCQPHWGSEQSRWGKVAWRNGANTVEFQHEVGYRDGVFWEKGSEPTHLYEIHTDGTGLRQLTDDPLYCDREPAYLPDGNVVFSSDRGCGASQCGAAPLAYSDFALPNLFRVSADGGQVQRLTYNKDVDRYPHCLSNGMIGYMRWDYQERFWQWPHALWTIRPDGTMNDGLFKTHFQDPQSLREPRSIPGSEKLVVIACGHHAPPEGAVAIVDPSRGVNNPAGLHYVTPHCSPLEGGLGSSPTVPEGGVPDQGGFYRTPWPLSEKCFLVSYTDQPHPSHYAAYYIDVWGNKELLHRDPQQDVLCPMPLRKRPFPPILPSQIDPQHDYAVCYLDDVTRDMPEVAAGTVRYIRISERLQWYFSKQDNTGPVRWTPGTQHSRNFGYWSWSPTRVIGTVPVESDGSAYFKVPVGMAVYFQALDENMMEIRRMRSHVEFQPGELRGCVGCHETKEYVPRAQSRSASLAMQRPPSQPTPPPWGDVALIDYEVLIQPIFDQHCVRCHGAEPQHKLDLTATRDPHGFVQSYRSLFGLPGDVPTPLGEGFREANPDMPLLQPEEGNLYETVKAGIYVPGGLLCLSNHMSGPEVTAPKQFGSHRSRLVLTLLQDETHRREVALTEDQWETLVTWVDANAPYSGRFYQYFDSDGKLLPHAVQVDVDLDPPFQHGEKGYRVVAISSHE